MSKIHRKSVTNRRPPARTRARGRRPEFLSARIPARSTTAKPRRPTTIEVHRALPSKPQICNLSCSLQTAPLCWLMQKSPRPKNVDCQCHPPGSLRPIGDTSRQQQAWRHQMPRGCLELLGSVPLLEAPPGPSLQRHHKAGTSPGLNVTRSPPVLYLIC